ncbi:response regulator [Nitratireductor luteus]|uniref:response regulator n=1 Tax=Nitratireductor luteus TaxID=2976980 RepID=UPI00223FD5E6|nr:response regulator [Nitratireductor luteus]
MDDLLSGRRVLVIEDEMLIVLMIEDMLADLGCESVTAAATIDKALASIEEHVFDAAMLDMNLNGDDSLKVADALTARGLPFVYCTGNNGHGMRVGSANIPVLRKPFSFEELTAILTRLLSR